MDFSISNISDESGDEAVVFGESHGFEFITSEPISFEDSPATPDRHSPLSFQYDSNFGAYGYGILDSEPIGSDNFEIEVPHTSIGSNVPPWRDSNSSIEPHCCHCGQAIRHAPARPLPQISRRTSSGTESSNVYGASDWADYPRPRDSTFPTHPTLHEEAGATPPIYQHHQDFLSVVNGTLSSKIAGHGSLGLLLAGSSYVPDNCGARRDEYRGRLTRIAEYLTLEDGTAEFLTHCDSIASTAVGNCGDRVIQGITLLECAILGCTLQHLPPFDQYEALKGIKLREVVSLYADQIGGVESTEVFLSLCFAMRQRGWNVLDQTHESLHAGRSSGHQHLRSSSWTMRSQKRELNRKLTLMVNGPQEGPNKGIPDSGYIRHFLEHECFKQVLRQTYPEDWSLVDQTRDDFNEEAIEAVQAGGVGEAARNQLLRDFATVDDRFYLNAFITGLRKSGGDTSLQVRIQQIDEYHATTP
ncbi:hypothetical protein F4604DRAFT_1676402 [Suillus subluteus]|nr:hypothetical protein F4604DRAFT_1676402 [Suillus subluteus]